LRNEQAPVQNVSLFLLRTKLQDFRDPVHALHMQTFIE
jgi:hypothetical protein